MSEGSLVTDVSAFQSRLTDHGYIAEQDLAATLLLVDQLQRPLLLEGDAGVGKTEVAKVLSRVYQCPLIRLQCYEGLDVSSSVYEWNYQHQLLSIKLHESNQDAVDLTEKHIFSEKYLLKRPLLQAISEQQSAVLLIDEIDRADEEFEAFLLEVLSDYQITIPELGTIKAKSIPRVILTSNGTREISDALRRRCLYYYLDYPSYEKELRIVIIRFPNISQILAGQIVGFVQQLRKQDLRKNPGLAETLDWVAAIMTLDIKTLDDSHDEIMSTLVCMLKTREDRESVTSDVVSRLIAKS